MKEKYLLTVIIILFFLPVTSAHGQIWVEAEQFQEKGGWIVDPQFIDQMGSAYLLAHGLGEPVQPARTILQIKKIGNYHLWVRTKDWAPYPTGPGKFTISIDSDTLPTVLGQDGNSSWHWVYAGVSMIKQPEITLSINDLSGFEGRVRG